MKEIDYNYTRGYTHNDSYDLDSLVKAVGLNFKLIGDYIELDNVDTILNIGCGNGLEAIAINKVTGKRVLGIDIYADESLSETDVVNIFRDDFCTFDFNKQKFDIIHCCHVLEHVDNPDVVVGKAESMITVGGCSFWGFPNKNRLVGYINPSEAVGTVAKIMKNINDYKKRLMGRFENRYGAHAGFSQKEFKDMASIHFNVHNVSKNYYDSKYAANKLYKIINNVGLMNYIQPSLYYILKLKD